MARTTLSHTTKVDNTWDVMAAHVNLLQTEMEKVWNTFAFVEATELTIVAGVVTATNNYHTIDTAADADSDDLDTITISGNICEGSLLFIRPDNDARTIVIKHGTGNISCVGQADITLDDVEDFAILIYDETLVSWLAMSSATGPVSTSLCNGRLTGTTAVPVTTADVVDFTDLFFTPYKGNEVSLYDGTNWIRHEFTERTLDISAFTASKNYDIFLYNNAGTLTLSGTVWTNDTTRATALVAQDGVLCKTGALTYRYLGTIYMDAAQKCQDTTALRYVWNYYNRVPEFMKCVDTTDNWTYTTATWRAANGSSTDGVGRFSFVIGVNEELISANSSAMAYNASAVYLGIGIGLDKTNGNDAIRHGGAIGPPAAQNVFPTEYVGFTGIGLHYLQRVEWSTATGTTSWYGDLNPAAAPYQSGMIGVING